MMPMKAVEPLLPFVVDKLVWSPWYAVDDAHEGHGAPVFDSDG